MSTIDRSLAEALKSAKTKSMNFVFVSKSPGEGRLIVCKDRISSHAIDQARKELGGGQVLQGRCTGDGNGQVVFETNNEPSLTLARTLKTIITRDAGLNLKVDARKAVDSAGDAGGDPPAAESKHLAGDAPSKSEIGLDTTPHAPPPPPPPPRNGGTVADSQPPKPRDAGGMTPSQVAAENARVRGYKPPPFRPHPGDGEAIALEKAFAELAKKNGQVLESGSHAFHRNAWQNWLGKQGEPPVAFKLSGRIRVNIDRLTPEQLRTFVELEKAQAAALQGAGVSLPTKTPLSPPKLPPAPPKPASVGKTPASVPPTKSLALQYGEVSEKIGKLSKIGKRVSQGLKILASRGVQGLLTLVSEMLRALQAIDAVESALKGGGFIFTDTVAQASKLAARVEELVKEYRDAGYHKDLDAIIDLAREIDRQNPEALYGSDALSTFCASVDDDVAKHENECRKVLEEMIAIDERVTAGQRLIEKLWDDPAFLTAAVITKDDARMFMAHQDFKQIDDILANSIPQLAGHHKIVEGDLQRIKANIIGYMFLDE